MPIREYLSTASLRKTNLSQPSLQYLPIIKIESVLSIHTFQCWRTRYILRPKTSR